MPSLELDTAEKAEAKLAGPPPVEQVAELSTFTLAGGDQPVFITGDDGTVYQVAGQNEEGQTILITQDSEGQQQCLLVTNEAVQEDVAQIADTTEQPEEVAQEAMEIGEEQPVVAQFIRTEPPSPGESQKYEYVIDSKN